MNYQKKYWWVAGIAVPVIVAVVGIVPSLLSDDDSSGVYTVEIAGSQYNGTVEFNSVTIIEEQTRGITGEEMTAEITASLLEALKLGQSKNFAEAIPVYESVAEIAPTSAVLNNLGASYLATGNKQMAIHAFEKALTIDPDDETALFNLQQVEQSDKAVASADDMRSVNETEDQPNFGNGEQEPNNTIFQSNPLEVGYELNAEISDKKDMDYYVFQYKEKLRDKITIKMESRSTTLRPNVIIYDKNKSQIMAQHNETFGSDIELVLSAKPQLDYYIGVQPYSSSGQYRLTVVTHQAYDRHEANDDQFSATDIELGQTIDANIMDTVDTDWYKLTGIKSDEVTVRMESRSTTLRPNVIVYDKNKSQITSQYNETYGADLEFVFKAESGSGYYLRVLPYGSHGNYQLTTR